MHCNWRDCQAWVAEGLPLSTTSNEACKLWDANITQYVSWHEDSTVGGLEKCLSDMLKADSNFLMGHVLLNGLTIMGTGVHPEKNSEFNSCLKNMENIFVHQSSALSWRERKHFEAVRSCARGEMLAACDIWEEILIEHPTDMLAIKFAHDGYFYLGKQIRMRNSIARVIPSWKKALPLYSYLKGMHAFGLVETNLFVDAEKTAREGLSLNRRDGWATHSIAHVLEMTCHYKEGINFMSSTVGDWETCDMLASHNFWHWALYHIEKGEYEPAVEILEHQVIARAAKSGSMLDIVDAGSLGLRLHFDGVDTKESYGMMADVCARHVEDHLMVFNDAHLLMNFLCGNNVKSADSLMKSLRAYLKSGSGLNHRISLNVAEPLCQAIFAFYQHHYDEVVELMLPIKDEIGSIGGSNAQRDIFELLLIHAALNSPDKKHHSLSRSLLYERCALREESTMMERLRAKYLSIHGASS